MGNGASIFLNADLQNSLSQKSIQTFQDFENECIAQKLNAEQIYDLLVSKYEELLNFDSHKKVEQSITPSFDEKKDVDQQEIRRNSCPKPKMNAPSWGTTVSAKKKHETRAKINAYYSQLHKKKSSTFPNEASSTLSSTSSDASSPEKVSPGKISIEMEDTSRQSSDETVCLCRMDSLDSLAFNDDSSTVYIGEMGEDLDTSASLDHFEQSVKTEPDRCHEHYECKLCNKQFNGRWRLQKHLRYSEVHKQTLHALKEKFFDEADGLNKLTKRAIQHFQESLSISNSYFEGNVNKNRLRWKKAIGKVVSSFISRKYESIVDQLQLQGPHNPFSFNRPLDDNKISLIHISSKFFWRNKSRFLFHFYFHEVYNYIEIVPQLLPSSTVTIDDSNDTNNAEDVYSSIQKEFLLNPNQRKKLENITPSPRFFVNCRVINKIIAQQTASRPVEETTILTEDQQQSSASSDGTNNNSNNSNKSAKKEGDTTSTVNPYEIPILVSSVQSTQLEMCKFLLSKLKLDYSLIDNNMVIEKAIYFESQHSMKNNQNIEINTMIPHGLKPVILPSFDGKKPPLYEQWEIKNKLNEIVSSHQELNNAVNKAEEISKSILLISPRFLHCLSPLLSPTKRMANKMMLNNHKTSGSNSRIPLDSIYFPSSSAKV
jgi:stress-induced morphogen